MYFYFYDKLTQEKQHESTLTSIETRLIDLGINGRVEKLSIFKNAKELIEDGIKKGAHTVVAVGDDKTFTTAVNVVAPYDVTFGFIPLTGGSRYGALLGMPTGAEAAEVISKRRALTVDLGRIGEHYFFGALELPRSPDLRLRCDRQYTVSPTNEENLLRVLNAGDVLSSTEPVLADAADSKLSLHIAPVRQAGVLKRKTSASARPSVFPAERIEIDSASEPLPVEVDQLLTVNTPCAAEVIPNGMKIIVGKNRTLLVKGGASRDR